MACSNNTLPTVIDLTQVRDDSPPVIDLTADTPPQSPRVRPVTPIAEIKPELEVLVPATQAQANNENAHEGPAGGHINEDDFLDHPPPQPADRRFPSCAAVIRFLNDWASEHGFALVITTSTPADRKAYLGCICHPQKSHQQPLIDQSLRDVFPGAATYQPPPRVRQRKRTIKTGCPFKMYIKDRSLSDGGRGRGYQVGAPESWSFEICEGHAHHNHPPLPAIAVAFMRRLETDEREWVVAEVKKGISAMDIVRGFRARYPGQPIQTRDVWNLAYSVRKSERAGFSASEAALAKMRDLGELHDAWTNDHGQLVGLAYTSSKARALTHRYSTGLFFDCTYKTNLYKLPLLHIVGSTATGQTFTAAVVLILRETTAWYHKAISSALKILGSPSIEIAFVDREPALHNALLELRPGIRLIYCLWHLKENIKDRCAKDFSREFGGKEGQAVGDSASEASDSEDDAINDSEPTPTWRKKLGRFILEWESFVVRAKTPEAMRDGVAQVRHLWGRYEGLRGCINYVCIELLLKKEHFVHAFTDTAQHFGQRSSSSIEGRHYKLKRNIKRSRADVFYLFEVIRRYLDDEWDRINHRAEEERTILARDLGIIYSNLNGRVSRKCLELLKVEMSKFRAEERAKADATLQGIPFLSVPCLGSTRHAYGIPCSHDLKRYVDGAFGIPLDLVHRHWHLTSTAKMEDIRGRLDAQFQPEGEASGLYERLDPSVWDDVQPRVSNPPRKRSNNAQHQRKRARMGQRQGNGSNTQATGSNTQATASSAPATDPNTGRILSQGERIDGARVRARTCGHCGRTGHDLRRCPEGEGERARRAAEREARQESQALNVLPSSQHWSSTPHY